MAKTKSRKNIKSGIEVYNENLHGHVQQKNAVNTARLKKEPILDKNIELAQRRLEAFQNLSNQPVVIDLASEQN